MKIETKLKQILAYALSGQRSYAACDIPTRDLIDRLIPAIKKACGVGGQHGSNT